jgi:hypothetical protein
MAIIRRNYMAMYRFLRRLSFSRGETALPLPPQCWSNITKYRKASALAALALALAGLGVACSHRNPRRWQPQCAAVQPSTATQKRRRSHPIIFLPAPRMCSSPEHTKKQNQGSSPALLGRLAGFSQAPRRGLCHTVGHVR